MSGSSAGGTSRLVQTDLVQGELVQGDLVHTDLAAEGDFGCHVLGSESGLSVSVLPSGCLYAIQHDDVLISQLLASPVAGGIHRLCLRELREVGETVDSIDAVELIEVIGPQAASAFHPRADRCTWSGSCRGLNYRCTCWVHPPRAGNGGGWFFHLEVANQLERAVRCDAIAVQDVGLAVRGQVRNNELFTAQYLDHRAQRTADVGYVLMTRQNLPQHNVAQSQGRHPWLMQGCIPRAAGISSDGFDLFGTAFKAEGIGGRLSAAVIGERVRQSEAAYTAVQAKPIDLPPGGHHAWTFFGLFVEDHPEPTSEADATRVDDALLMRAEMLESLQALAMEPAVEPDVAREPVRLPPATPQPVRSVFQDARLFVAQDFDEADVDRHFPLPRRHEEYVDGRRHSLFHGADGRHVVFKAKELSVARPHGHIMRSGVGLAPDAAELMSCTSFCAGVFVSQLTLGNTSLGKLLSAARDPLNLVRSSGLRIFVRRDLSEHASSHAAGEWQLLGVPSAFEMVPDQCRWLYKGDDGSAVVVNLLSTEREPALHLEVQVDGGALELLICGEIAGGPSEYESSPRLTIDRDRRRIAIRPDLKSPLGEREPGLALLVLTSTPGEVAELGGDELLFGDHVARRLPYFVVRTRPTTFFRCSFLGTIGNVDQEKVDEGQANARCEQLGQLPAAASWRPPTAAQAPVGGLAIEVRLAGARDQDPSDLSQIQDALTWFARDAVIHLSTPRGLEQSNGGAWGVRDVCQGSVEFLLTYGHDAIAADVLRKVFARQFDGRFDWPQWFMFPPFEAIQAREAHGDVIIWPLKALCDYLEHSNDERILHERLPYTDVQTGRPTDRSETVLEHVDRLLTRLRGDFLPGVSLPRYGEGDWDDSLQPADPVLRERMVSSWTVALMHQTLRRYGAAMAHFGEAARAAVADAMAEDLARDFHHYLMPEGVVAGFAVFDGDPPRPVEYLLHPSDARTGIGHRLISMTRGILSGIFSREQAGRHLDLIREHLLYPDGARLMDKPATYTGGLERNFRRAESAAFFGREIGLQYVHAHLRYAEAMAAMGRGEDLWHALRVVNPIAVTDVVPNARPRQRNCYFSSSDAAFGDRYEGSRDYAKLQTGEVPVDGGWRVYSSGPGIYTNIVIRHLFGLRRHFDWMEFDPVLPLALDGVSCELPYEGRRVRYQFTVRSDAATADSARVVVNGHALPAMQRAANSYRAGATRVRRADFDAALTAALNVVHVLQ